jgi:3-keto-5-aminohexanoate cleavage enzyme
MIEAAINGGNPAAPRSPSEIAECASACLDAGAAIVHNHIDLVEGDAAAVADRYEEGWAPVLAKHPDALLYPTINGVGAAATRFAHLGPLAERGVLEVGIVDPGSVNLGSRFAYVNSGSDIDHAVSVCERHSLAPSIAIFEPGFLRAALAYWRAGRLPAGAMLRFYFGGDDPEAAGDFWFGLPPTEPSLEAYLSMLDGCPLPWSVAVLGGDVLASSLPTLAIELGGHLRVGLEDHTSSPARNEELVARAVAVVEESGRRVATPTEARAILGLRVRS